MKINRWQAFFYSYTLVLCIIAVIIFVLAERARG